MNNFNFSPSSWRTQPTQAEYDPMAAYGSNYGLPSMNELSGSSAMQPMGLMPSTGSLFSSSALKFGDSGTGSPALRFGGSDWNPGAATAPAGFFGSIGQTLKDSGFLSSYNQKTRMQDQGWGGLAINALSGISNLYLGMKQYGLAKDQLGFAKSSFQKNFDAQKNTTNSMLEDRQRQRNRENPTTSVPVSEYMERFGVKG